MQHILRFVLSEYDIIHKLRWFWKILIVSISQTLWLKSQSRGAKPKTKHIFVAPLISFYGCVPYPQRSDPCRNIWSNSRPRLWNDRGEKASASCKNQNRTVIGWFQPISLSPVQQIVLGDSSKSRASQVGISLIPPLASSHSYKVGGYQQIPSTLRQLHTNPLLLHQLSC